MENLDIDETKHHDKDHRSNGEEDDVSFAPVKNVFKHDLHLKIFTMKIFSGKD